MPSKSKDLVEKEFECDLPDSEEVLRFRGPDDDGDVTLEIAACVDDMDDDDTLCVTLRPVKQEELYRLLGRSLGKSE